MLGTAEHQAVQQGRSRLIRLLPIPQALLQLLVPHQKHLGPVQPTGEQGPLAQEGLMGHLHHPLPIRLPQPTDQQAGLHQPLQDRPGVGGQVVPTRRPPHKIPHGVDPHHGRHKGLLQGPKLPFGGLQGGQHPIGGPPHRIFEGRKPGGSIPIGLVIGQGEAAALAKALIQFPQGEGEQGQGILRTAIGQGRLDKTGFHGQTHHLGRPLDHFGDPGQGHGGEGHGFKGNAEVRRPLPTAQKFRAQGQHRRKGQIRGHGGTEEPQEAPRLLRLHQGEQLLGLVNRQNEPRFWRRGLQAQIGGDARPPGGQAIRRFRRQQGLQHLAVPVRPHPQAQGQDLGQLLDGMALGPHRFEGQPLPAAVGQPGQESGPQQRGLAGAGVPQQNQQGGTAVGAPHRQPFDQGRDLLVTAEVNGRILGLEGHQTGERRATGIPGKPSLAIEGQLLQNPS